MSVFTGLSDNLLRFVSGIGEHIGDFFKGSATGKGLGMIGRLASGAKGIFGRMLGRVIKILKPIAKKIPILGTVIGLGFAYTRFKSGDTVGGIIDVLSAVASLMPFAGTAISIGLDVLNAFLDYISSGISVPSFITSYSILVQVFYTLCFTLSLFLFSHLFVFTPN